MAIDSSNGFNLFGFAIKRKAEKQPESFVAAPTDDGNSSIITNTGAGYNAYYLDLDPSSIKTDTDLIMKYREIAMTPDLDQAIDEIVNEMLVYDDKRQCVNIDFTDDFAEKYSKKTRELIEQEFQNITTMLNLNSIGYDIARKWYVDGRLAYHKVIGDDPKKGILELRPIDSLKIRKIIEVKKEKDASGVDIVKSTDEYFVYTDKGFVQGDGNTKAGIKISKDAIAWVTSGLLDAANMMVVGYLHKAIWPLNQLRLMEDSTVIYKMVRAPERRVFYIDTSGMNRTRAEQYVKDVMARYKNKQVYDAKTGELKDDKKHLSILEDFWLPRANGGKGTEITTLPGGQGFGDMSDVQYFQNKLYQALNIPISRMQGGTPFNIGRSSEISRDEVKFSKFVDKLRRKFNSLFVDLLKTQLILKGITSLDDWNQIKDHIKFNYVEDNYYAELKDSEIFKDRIQNVLQADQLAGKYFSKHYIQRNIMKLTQNDIDEMDVDMEKEQEADAAAQAAMQPQDQQAPNQGQQ